MIGYSDSPGAIKCKKNF